MLFVLYFLVFCNSLVTPDLSKVQIAPNPGQIDIMYVEHSGPYVLARDRIYACPGTMFGVLAVWSGFFWGVYLMVIVSN